MAAAAPTMRVRADTAELARVRRRVAAWAEAAGLSSAVAHRLQLAVDETVANAIEHGLAPGTRQLTVAGSPGRGRLAVTVRYRGPAFDPTTEGPPSAEPAIRKRAPHGYGLHLMRSLVDRVDYRRVGGVNEVQLTVAR